MSRETKEIKTPGGHIVVVNTYLTGREENHLKAIMFSAMKMNVPDAASGKVEMADVQSTFLADQETKALEFLVVSLDGDATNAADRLLDLPATEYKAVLEEINAIQNPTTPAK